MTGLFPAEKPAPKAAREPLPKDGPGNRWAYDWRGRPVNLWGLRAGEDGRPLPGHAKPMLAPAVFGE